MTLITDRVLQFAKRQHVSLRQIEQKIKASNGLLSNAIRKKTDIQSKWVSEIIYNYPELNAEWLLTGRGKMLKSNNGDVIGNKLGDGNKINIGSTVTIKESIKKDCSNVEIEAERLKAELSTSKIEIKYLKEKISDLEKQLTLKDRIIEMLEQQTHK